MPPSNDPHSPKPPLVVLDPNAEGDAVVDHGAATLALTEQDPSNDYLDLPDLLGDNIIEESGFDTQVGGNDVWGEPRRGTEVMGVFEAAGAKRRNIYHHVLSR